MNAWAGGESIEPFASYGDRGVYVWVKSSNPGGDDLQMLEVNGSPLLRPSSIADSDVEY